MVGGGELRSAVFCAFNPCGADCVGEAVAVVSAGQKGACFTQHACGCGGVGQGILCQNIDCYTQARSRVRGGVLPMSNRVVCHVG